MTEPYNQDAKDALEQGFIDQDGYLLLKGKLILETKKIDNEGSQETRTKAAKYVWTSLGRPKGELKKEKNNGEFLAEKEKIDTVLKKYSLDKSTYSLRAGDGLKIYDLYLEITGKENWVRSRLPIKQRGEKIKLKLTGEIDEICSSLENYLLKNK